MSVNKISTHPVVLHLFFACLLVFLSGLVSFANNDKIGPYLRTLIDQNPDGTVDCIIQTQHAYTPSSSTTSNKTNGANSLTNERGALYGEGNHGGNGRGSGGNGHGNGNGGGNGHGNDNSNGGSTGNGGPGTDGQNGQGSHNYGTVKTRFESINGYVTTVKLKTLDDMAKDPEVLCISLDAPVRPNMDITSATSRALQARSYFGLGGDGIGIAVIDSGIAAHPDLPPSRIVYSESFVSGEDVGDFFGHGTHVAGIIVGNGSASGLDISTRTFTGIAPNAQLINIFS